MKVVAGAVVLFIIAGLLLLGIDLAFGIVGPITVQRVFGTWLALMMLILIRCVDRMSDP